MNESRYQHLSFAPTEYQRICMT